MRIIRVGQKPEDKEAEWTCKRCRSLISAKASEGRVSYDQRDGDAIVFNCPHCGVENWVDRKLFK